MLAKYSLKHLVDWLLGIIRLKFSQQALHQFSDLLQMLTRVLSLEVVDVLPGVPLQIRRKHFGIMDPGLPLLAFNRPAITLPPAVASGSCCEFCWHSGFRPSVVCRSLDGR